MKLAIGADHAAFELKGRVKHVLDHLGHEAVDFGTHSDESVDYPDFALKVAHAVASGEVERGIVMCWTGNGSAIAANKVNGIRAGMALNRDMAFYTRLHNDANVLALGSKYLHNEEIESILEAFLETEFEGGRHLRRIEKIAAEERS